MRACVRACVCVCVPGCSCVRAFVSNCVYVLQYVLIGLLLSYFPKQLCAERVVVERCAIVWRTVCWRLGNYVENVYIDSIE